MTHVLPHGELAPDTLLHADVLTAGMQLSHTLLGLLVPLAYTVPPMSHGGVTHVPPMHFGVSR